MKEIWVNIQEVGLPNNYQISNLGRIKSLDHKVETMYKSGEKRMSNRKGKILSPTITNSGYLQIALTNKSCRFYIHRLVAKYFIGELGSGKFRVVNHKDGDKKNNLVTNLEITTSSLNQIHSHRVLGNKVHNISLDKQKAEEIREIYRNGKKSQAFIAKMYGVSVMVINRIINNVQNEYK